MAGLNSSNMIIELQAEIAWLRQVVSELSAKLDHSSYYLFILEKHLEYEEISVFEKVIFSLGPGRSQVGIESIEELCAERFKEETGKEWFMSREVLAELSRIHISERYEF